MTLSVATKVVHKKQPLRDVYFLSVLHCDHLFHHLHHPRPHTLPPSPTHTLTMATADLNQRGLQEVSDAIDNVVDYTSASLDSNSENVSRVVSYAEAAFAAVSRVYTEHRETVRFFAHLSVVFYGPLFEKCILAGKTYTNVTHPLIKENLAGISEEYWKVRAEKRRNGGDITPFVLLEAVDPRKIEQCAKGVLAGVAACLIGLQAPHLQIFASGFSIGEYVSSALQKTAAPCIQRRAEEAEEAGTIPVGSTKWFEMAMKVFCMIAGVYAASIVRRPLAAAAAIAESSGVVTSVVATKLGMDQATRPLFVFQHSLTLLGIYHVLVLGGHERLPTAVKWILAVPLSCESFLGLASSVASFGAQ